MFTTSPANLVLSYETYFDLFTSQFARRVIYLNRETGTNLHCKIARGKQKKTIELVRNNA